MHAEESAEVKLAVSLLPKLDILSDFPATNPQWFSPFASPGTTVIDVQDVPDPYLLKTILEMLLGNLWTQKVRSRTGCPLVLVFDECQDLNFQAGSILDRILRKGRKYEIAGWFSTQWFQDETMTKALGQTAADIARRCGTAKKQPPFWLPATETCTGRVWKRWTPCGPVSSSFTTEKSSSWWTAGREAIVYGVKKRPQEFTLPGAGPALILILHSPG